MSSEKNKAPLGVFDSGVGGLTVAREIAREMPCEEMVYLGDTARLPYGSKSPDTVRRFALEDADFLMSRGVKAIVVACNTATAFALPILQREMPVPVIGVLDAGVEAALQSTRNGRLGLIGTVGTVASQAYQKELKRRSPNIHVVARATPLLVPLIEEGWLDHPATKLVLKEYLESFLEQDVDTLLLACTHYPLLKPVISSILGEGVSLVDSSTTCALHLRRIMEEKNMVATRVARGKMDIYLTDQTENFESLARCIVPGEIRKISAAALVSRAF